MKRNFTFFGAANWSDNRASEDKISPPINLERKQQAKKTGQNSREETPLNPQEAYERNAEKKTQILEEIISLFWNVIKQTCT